MFSYFSGRQSFVLSVEQEKFYDFAAAFSEAVRAPSLLCWLMALSPLMGDKGKEPKGAADGKVWWQAGGEDAGQGLEWLLGGGAQERTLVSCEQRFEKEKKNGATWIVSKDEEKYRQEGCVKMWHRIWYKLHSHLPKRSFKVDFSACFMFSMTQ